jgi:hypothetical protein
MSEFAFFDYVGVLIGWLAFYVFVMQNPEAVAEWTEDWRDRFEAKMKPVTDAYRNFQETHAKDALRQEDKP